MCNNLIVIVLIALLHLGCQSEKSSSQSIKSVSDSETIVLDSKATTKVKDDSHLNTNGLEWKELKDILNKSETGSKMLLLDIYTSWCGYCKLMDKKTFSDKSTQKLLSENFELVKFDAESQDSLMFLGKKYGWRPNGKKGIHELAAKLMDGKLSYPTLIFFDENLRTIRVSRGYKNPAEFTQEVEMALRS